METINGYTVIAQRPVWAGVSVRRGLRVILAVRDLTPNYTGYEYVVAVTAPREEAPTEWQAGHYFRDTLVLGAEPAILRATEAFRTR